MKQEISDLWFDNWAEEIAKEIDRNIINTLISSSAVLRTAGSWGNWPGTGGDDSGDGLSNEETPDQSQKNPIIIELEGDM